MSTDDSVYKITEQSFNSLLLNVLDVFQSNCLEQITISCYKSNEFKVLDVLCGEKKLLTASCDCAKQGWLILYEMTDETRSTVVSLL
jgi:hypothetical protein